MPEYNLGSGKSYSILDVANMVIKTGEDYGCNTTVNVVGDNDKSKIGMDNTLFCNEFNWHPQYSMMDQIKSLFEMLMNPKWGGYPKAFKMVYHL
jgi:nucleoside-diphosphate-sugar epimerase